MAEGEAKSAWSKPPIDPEGAKAAPHAADRQKRARAVAEEVGVALRDGLAEGADRVGKAMRSGIGSVEKALEDPAGAASVELLRQTDLPELEGEDPLASIGLRLDREADLWRGVAMRQLARAAWMDRLSVITTAVVLAGAAILAAIAGFRAMFSPEGAPQAAALVGAGALLLYAGSLTIGRAATRVRQGQIEVAREALLRADLAELRLHRLAALMELRAADHDAYLGALRAFESDVRRA